MIVRQAEEADVPGFLGLAAEVEHWFGPMVEDPGFLDALHEHIREAGALVAVAADGSPGLLGGLLFGGGTPVCHIHWLVVARAARGGGAGRAMMAEALRGCPGRPGTVEVVTFGADHPGAVDSGARAFYERLGFVAGEAAAPGPEGGSRQVYRLTLG